ncbi:probable WRKY transcription factor 32 [Helianthus annuus]|uniref:probable WRKY transcription factor 32 n=1 Tax=Helianthus annuus TaxID=4232 RepID=UPI001652BB85|nr:probable WRKY transcription factor 32 [Helianthus annuus]
MYIAKKGRDGPQGYNGVRTKNYGARNALYRSEKPEKQETTPPDSILEDDMLELLLKQFLGLSETTTTVTPLVNADGSEVGQKDPIGSEFVNVATDSYTWRKYGMKQVKNPEGGSRSYYMCAYSACDAKKIESCERYNFTIKIVYKGQHKHDPPKRVASKGGELLKRKLVSTLPIQVEQIDHLEIKQRLEKNSSSYGNPGSRNCLISKTVIRRQFLICYSLVQTNSQTGQFVSIAF